MREIEVKTVKYMDDLESGKEERNLEVTIKEQVEKFRDNLFKDVT